jgi:hypothetical protein
MKNAKIIAICVLAGLLALSIVFNIIQAGKSCEVKELSAKEADEHQPVLVEAMFVNFYMSNVQAKGVLIFKNIGTETYDSSKFRLLINEELQDANGCEKTGEVPPEALCSLSFKKICNPGDELAVSYNNVTIMTKEC